MDGGEPRFGGSSRNRPVVVGVFAGVLVAGSLVAAPLTTAAVHAGAPGCTIFGTARADILSGTAGADVICGLGGNDQLSGGDGRDLLRGGPGHDVLQGGAGDDGLQGGGGDDTVGGGPGADRLRGATGGDRLSGGTGRDVTTYMPRSAAMRLSIGDGANDGRRGEGDDIAADIEDVRGGTGNGTLIVSNGPNQLFGLVGNDRLVGGRGNDLLAGGAGTDVLDGVGGAGFVDDLSCGDGPGTGCWPTWATMSGRAVRTWCATTRPPVSC